MESEGELDQVIQQLSKLIDVIKIVNLSEEDAIERELVLIKVKATRETRSDIINVVNIFRANIVDVTPDDVVIELTARRTKSMRSVRSCGNTASSRLPARVPSRSRADPFRSKRCNAQTLLITHTSIEVCVIFIALTMIPISDKIKNKQDDCLVSAMGSASGLPVRNEKGGWIRCSRKQTFGSALQ